MLLSIIILMLIVPTKTPASMSTSIRPATLADLKSLVLLEERCFTHDRLSRRSFHYLLSRASATMLVAEVSGTLYGYVTVLYHTGTSLARLYSLAVDPEHRGLGIASQLLDAAEQDAVAHDCAYLRLEVRRDNQDAIRLYQRRGYRELGVYPHYYEDHMEALRFEKRLAQLKSPAHIQVPYYEQTTDFTCGPAALMMAMQALKPGLDIDRRLELRLWRESTTIFMTSGHGGCDPLGLALAAYRRGFAVQVYLNHRAPFMIESVRSEAKREVIREVHQDFVEEIERIKIPVDYRTVRINEVEAAFRDGAVPVILISSYRIYAQKFPHYLTITGFDEHFIYGHDPLIERTQYKSPTDSMHIPIAKAEFERMTRYGKSQQQAVLFLTRRDP